MLRVVVSIKGTSFLLRYINDAELRRTINAATNKSEESNAFVECSFFGGDGITSENIRYEQRKVVKYNHLMANMIMPLEDYVTQFVEKSFPQ
jgi:TnpA family transposase